MITVVLIIDYHMKRFWIDDDKVYNKSFDKQNERTDANRRSSNKWLNRVEYSNSNSNTDYSILLLLLLLHFLSDHSFSGSNQSILMKSLTKYLMMALEEDDVDGAAAAAAAVLTPPLKMIEMSHSCNLILV